MRMLGIAALSSVVALISGLGPFSQGEAVKGPGISFSLPYKCSKDEKTEAESLCLADSFKAGLKVALVSKKGNCIATTAGNFTDERLGSGFKVTRLTGAENCLNGAEPDVALIGIDPSAIHVVEPKNDKSALSKDMELKARKIASAAYKEMRNPDSVADVADSPPDVFSVGNTAFLLFKCTEDFFNQDGLPVLVLKDKAFLLGGACALKSPFFFSVKEKLHVAYWATVSCCGCGDSNFFIYDVSVESPKLVYQNSDFSD